MGRPLKLTKELQAEFCKVLQVCNSIEDTALHLDLNRTTVFKWLQKGRESKSGIYFDFFVATEQAKARRRINAQAQLIEHGKRHWQALMALMERTDPKHFSLRINVRVNDEMEALYSKFRKHMTPAEFKRALEIASTPDDSAEALGGIEGDGGPATSGRAAAVGAAVESALHGAESPLATDDED